MKLRRTLIDNSPEGYNMTEVLKECLKDKNVTEVYIATGFWDLRGTALVYDELAEFLKRDNSKFRLLIGKDPYLYTSDTESFTKGRYDKQEQAWRVDLDKFAAQEQYVKVVQMLVDNLKDKDNEKFQIHIYRPDGELKDQFLHSKCYIFKGYDHEEECRVGYGIIGSTNFTQRGMEGNSELNTLEVNARDVVSLDPEFKKDKTHLLWFNEKWEDSVSWEEEFLLQITQSKMAPDITIPEPEPQEDLTASLTPYELYIKLLQYKFNDIVDIDMTRQVESYLPKQFDPLQYQTDAVKQCYGIMQEHGGFMLADVVGLGKTVVGTMLVKHFLSVPDKDDREHQVLIVTPPAIKKGWVDTIAEFDKDRDDKIASRIDFITTGSIGKLIDDDDNDDDDPGLFDNNDNLDTGTFESELQHKNYGLIIIDESHKFRNSSTSMYKNIDSLISSIWENTGNYPYIGLLSATPQNNRPDDLKNQIYLFERNHTDSTLRKANGGNIESFFSDVNSRYTELISPKYNDPKSDDYIPRSDEERKAELKEISTQIRKCILEDILVRRTRTDVRNHYSKENGEQILTFPMVSAPESLKYVLTGNLPELFANTMNFINPDEEMPVNKRLGYFRYRAIEYLNDNTHRQLYEGRNIEVERVADQLANIMQLLLVKRLESSFDAFKESLSNLLQYTKNMIEMWNHDCIFICPQINVNAEFDLKTYPDRTFAERAEAIRQKIQKLDKDGRNQKQSNREYKREDFNAEYIEKLERDRDLLQSFILQWKDVEDPKKKVFRKELRKLLPETDPTKKLVIFTESVDTLRSIEKVVKDEDYSVLTVTAKDRNEKQITIQQNFDANYKGEKKDDYQVIITTDVLAEGINLHRAYTIINYDTPWNATRLMQRIGRVNRIGSTAPNVYVYNFMPSAEGDDKIRLVNRAYTKIQSFHTLFGEDSQVFTDNEEVTSGGINIQKMVDGEESPMMQYISELKVYKQAHPLRYDAILAKTEDLELATEAEQKESLFLIRNRATSGMYVQLAGDGTRQMLSLTEMFEHFRTEQDATSVELPADKDDLRRKAERLFRREFNNMRLRPIQHKMDDARNILVAITQKYPALSDSVSETLGEARELVDKGNVDICRTILKIGEYLAIDQPQLIPLTIDEIEAYIQQKLHGIDAQLQDNYGKGEIMMALYKL